jgi:hypothetical protein
MGAASSTQLRVSAGPRVNAGSFVMFALLALIGTTLILAFGPGLFAARNQPPSGAVLQAIAVATFLLDLALVAGVVCGLGYAVTGYASGIAMSSWNDYSLSKLQMALWTIVVVAALLTIAKIRILGYFGGAGHGIDPLAINIPPELLVAMGIAAFTTAATPAILALKASQTPDPGQIAAARQRVADTTSGVANDFTHTGNAIARIDPKNARWLDVIVGDETANAGIVDLSKVQQLLITLLLLGAYTGTIIRELATATSAASIDSLPPLSEGFLALMAVSHAGYLTYKAVPKSGQTISPAARSADDR